jgi:undecaprenyl-diphosphatase
MDTILFHFINTELSNPTFDLFFPWFTNIQRTQTFYWFLLPLILLATYYGAKWRGLLIVLVGVLLTWLVDMMVSSVLKPAFMRARPYDTGVDVILRTAKPSNSSFPSGHAVDAFFLATFLAMNFPRFRWAYFTVAFLIAFSRVYCGAHYPGDVVGGALIGTAFAYGLRNINRRLRT